MSAAPLLTVRIIQILHSESRARHGGVGRTGCPATRDTRDVAGVSLAVAVAKTRDEDDDEEECDDEECKSCDVAWNRPTQTLRARSSVAARTRAVVLASGARRAHRVRGDVPARCVRAGVGSNASGALASGLGERDGFGASARVGAGRLEGGSRTRGWSQGAGRRFTSEASRGDRPGIRVDGIGAVGGERVRKSLF